LIEIVAETASTNSTLLARSGQSEGDWLIADRQTAGRGRAGRVWNDGLGNFMGSTVARLRPGDPPAATLALVAGVALHRALEAILPPSPSGEGPGEGPLNRAQSVGTGPTPTPPLKGRGFSAAAPLLLKWPNDVMADGAKLAGILLERQGDAVVVGIGVNLASAPHMPDRPTVALAQLGCPVARDGFAQVLAHEWQSALTLWHAQGWAALREEWLARAHPRGTLLATHDRDAGLIIGAFAGLEPDGAALIRLADGTMRAIHAGDVDMVRD
jgi:BirA family biotin operon repressor/biotin-[acetyl-CoA-carboxylase] ligase